jgi:hypothetical protein
MNVGLGFTQVRAGVAMGTSLEQWPALVVTNGPQAGRSITLGAAPVVLGCSPDADLVIEGRGVSRRHAEVFGGRDGLQVRDLGPAGGTSLNGRLLDGPARLESGDSLRLGDVTLRVGMVVAIPQPRAPLSATTPMQIATPAAEEDAPGGKGLVLFGVGVALAFAGFIVWAGLSFSQAARGPAHPSPFKSQFHGVSVGVIGLALFVLGGVLAGYGQWLVRRRPGGYR